MNIDKTFEELGATSLSKCTIKAEDINKYGLRRKSGEEKDKDQAVFCLTCEKDGKTEYFYDYKPGGAVKRALKAKQEPNATA